jgi:hypothetical protein
MNNIMIINRESRAQRRIDKMHKCIVLSAILFAILAGVQSGFGQCYALPSPDNNEERIFAQSSCAGLDNNPSNPTVFTINELRTITKIGTYHWNDGKGTQTPGTIGLQGQNGKIYGPWQASGQPGQGGVLNAYWIVTLTTGLDLPAGTYKVLDSDPSTWAYNSESGNSGVVSIVGQTVGSTKAPKSQETSSISGQTGISPGWGGSKSIPVMTAEETIKPGSIWKVKEYGPMGNWDGEWVIRKDAQTIDASWSGGSITDIIDIKSIKGDQITLYRHKNKGYYTGTISPDGLSMSGTASWYSNGETWTATRNDALGNIGKPAVAVSTKTSGSTAVPLASIEAVKPTVITSPYEAVSSLVTLESGGEVRNGGATLFVPPGAVSKDTEVLVRRLTGEPPAGEVPESEAGSVIVVSDTFDFGPDDIKFNTPVRITLPYKEDLLPNGADEKDLLFVYFDGSGWRTTAGLIDTEKNTASIQVNKFPGFLIEVALGTLILGTGYVIKKELEGDLIESGHANEYVTPDDPVVKAYSKRAILKCDNKEKLNLNDPNLGEMLERNNGKAQLIFVNEMYVEGHQTYPKDELEPQTILGKMKLKLSKYGKIMPKDYLTSPDYKGDCVDITNAGVSLFLASGLHAKGVGGAVKYQNDPEEYPHAWAEVVIANKIYLLDEDGRIEPREVAMSRGILFRSTNPKWNRMWDNNGMTEYDPKWCKDYLTSSSNPIGIDCPSGHVCGTTVPVVQGGDEPAPLPEGDRLGGYLGK